MKNSKIKSSVQHVFIVFLFIFIISILGLISILDENAVFSDIENRYLTTAPNISKDGHFNKNYFFELEKYYLDTFPYRDKLLIVNRDMQTMYNKDFFKKEDEMIIIDVFNETDTENQDNISSELPIIGNKTFETFTYNETETLKYINEINRIYKESNNIKAYVITPPCAYDLYMPEKYRKPENDQKPVLDLLDAKLEGPKLIKLYDIFHNRKDEYLYYRTDHHWTALGAYYAYKEFMNEAGLESVELSEMKTGRKENFLGSLYKKAFEHEESKVFDKDPDYVDYYFPVYDTTIRDYKTYSMKNGTKKTVIDLAYNDDTYYYNMFFGGDLNLMHMKSEINNGKNIMVVRDSYGHAFLPFLANNYENVYAIEPRYFENFDVAKFMQEHEIDTLLFLNYALPATSEYWMNWSSQLEKLHR